MNQGDDRPHYLQASQDWGDWGDFEPEPKRFKQYVYQFYWIAILLALVFLLGGLGYYVWMGAESDETTLDRINGLSTLSLAVVGLGTAALAAVTLVNTRRAEIAQSRPVIFPTIKQDNASVFLVLINAGRGNAHSVQF